MIKKLSGQILFDNEDVKMLYYALTGDELTEHHVKENFKDGEIYSVSVKLLDDIVIYIDSNAFHIHMYPDYDIEGISVEDVYGKFKMLMEHEQVKLIHLNRLTETLQKAILVSRTIHYTQRKK